MAKHLLAYIPARGGSKRVRRKNIRELDGVPVLARVIRTLKKLDFVTHICVSTDDSEIAKIAQQEGATTLQLRAADLSDDHTSVVDLFKQDLPRFLSACGVPKELAEILIVLPTAALLQVDTLLMAYDKFARSGAPLLVSLRELDYSPARALELEKDGRYHPFSPSRLMQRTQDLPPAAVDAGQFYFLRYNTMSSHQGHWFTTPSGVDGIVLSAQESIDVDTEEDWLNLERVFRTVS